MFKNIQQRMRKYRRGVHRSPGQTSVMLIVLIAVSLIIYAVTLNLGKIAQYKSTTTVASNVGAAQMASFLASYGQSTWKQTLGSEVTDNKPMKCESTNFLVMVFVVIITIIVTIFTWGMAWPLVALAIAALVLAIAALVVNLVVIQPGLTSLWNKMQKDMELQDQIVERGIASGLQAAVNDPETVYDHFDMDLDGFWVTDKNVSNMYKTSNHVDKISRFSFFYTRRMELIKTELPTAMADFTKALAELIYDNPMNKKDPISCNDYQNKHNICCLSDDAINGDGSFDNLLGMKSEVYKSVRPKVCDDLECSATTTTDPNGCCATPKDTINPKCSPPDAFGLHDPLCQAGVDPTSAICDPCCASNPEERPKTCAPKESDLAQKCINENPVYRDDSSVGGTLRLQNYPFIYDKFAENETNNNDPKPFISFREWLGTDDENRLFEKHFENPNGAQKVTNNYPYPLVPNMADPNSWIINAWFSMQDATGFFLPQGTTVSVTTPAPYSVTGGDAKKGVYPLLWEWSKWTLDTQNIGNKDPNFQMSYTSDACHWCERKAVAPGWGSCDQVSFFSFINNGTWTAKDQVLEPDVGGRTRNLIFEQLDLESAWGIATGAGGLIDPHCQGANCCVNLHANSLTDYTQSDPRVTDVVRPISSAGQPDKLRAPDNMCASTLTSQDPTGLWWKPGGDQFCSEKYVWDGAYYAGPYTINCQKAPNCTMTCTAYDADGYCLNYSYNGCTCETSSNPTWWPEDSLDNMVYGMKTFLDWAQFILGQKLSDLAKTFPDWYNPSAQEWMAYACSTCAANCGTSTACNDVECNSLVCSNQESLNGKQRDGWLIIWRDQLKGWGDTLNDWLNMNFADANAWCVPPSQPAEMPTDEWNAIKDYNGTINGVIACLDWNTNNIKKFNDAADIISGGTCSAATFGSLPRSLVPGFNANSYTAPSSAELSKYASCMYTCDKYLCTPTSAGGYLPVPTATAFDVQVECNGADDGSGNYISDGTWKDKGDAFYKELENTVQNSSCFNGLTGTVFNAIQPNGTPLGGIPWVSLFNTAPSGLSALEKMSTSAKLAISQVAKFKKRSAYLKAIVQRATEARAIFYQGYQRLYDFLRPPSGVAGDLGGPAYQLKQALIKYVAEKSKTPSLPNFAIYGWQTRPVTKYESGVPQTGQPGYWHIVRVEAFAPKRCPEAGSGFCQETQFPKVKTKTHFEGIDQIRCYEMKYRKGRAMTRVTRYDEDHYAGNTIKFPNGVPIWDFKYTSKVSDADPKNLGKDCGLSTWDPGILGAVSPETKNKLEKAFMINKLPDKNDPLFAQQVTCWKRIVPLLEQGMDSRTCARYYWMNEEGGPESMGVQFIAPSKCDLDGALNKLYEPLTDMLN